MIESSPFLEITIVMPCLNEALTLGSCIEEAKAALVQADVAGEILIADNGSTDGSQEIAARLGARVLHVSAKGYGNALRGGIEAAKGKYVMMGDADGSYDYSHLPRFLDALRKGHDLVMGNRFRGGIQPGAMPWKNRYIGNPILSFLGRLFFGAGIGDFHCGLRAFSIEAYHRMDLQTTGMEFASEMVIKAVTQGLRVTEVPTVLRPDGRNRPPHLRPWRDGWRHLRFMLLFSPRWLFLVPGIVLMAAGGVAMTILIPGPVRLGRTEFDVHTLLFAAFAVLLGFQAISFAALGKYFSIRAGLRGREKRFESSLDRLTLEFGLVAGALLVLLGLGVSGSAVWVWGRNNFGPLQPAEMLRWTIPGALSLALGCQLILTSFFLGVLRLDTRAGKA